MRKPSFGKIFVHARIFLLNFYVFLHPKTNKNRQPMKRIFLALLAVITLGITTTSCSKEGLVESVAYLVDVRYDDWKKDASLNYVYCPIDISSISGNVLTDGTVTSMSTKATDRIPCLMSIPF